MRMPPNSSVVERDWHAVNAGNIRANLLPIEILDMQAEPRHFRVKRFLAAMGRTLADGDQSSYIRRRSLAAHQIFCKTWEALDNLWPELRNTLRLW
jgi:hypothetical protein